MNLVACRWDSNWLWIEEFLDEFLAVFEAAETGDGLQDVRIAIVFGRQNVRLNHWHHGQFQFQLASPASSASGHYPRVPVNFSQLHQSKIQDIVIAPLYNHHHSIVWKKKSAYGHAFLRIDFDHAAKQRLAFRWHEMGDVIDTAFDFLQQLPQIVVVER